MQLLGLHPLSLVLVVAYVYGINLLAKTHRMPMWMPRRTSDTRFEKEVRPTRKRVFNLSLWVKFIICSMIVGASGWVLSVTGLSIVKDTGMSEGLVGGVFTAVSTSLPELVIAITAVRLRALTLAVGDIIGGNAFDTLFIAVSDVAYRQGSIYAGISSLEQFWLAVTLLMSGILLMGLLHRERHGIANIGWESFLVLLIYIGSLVYVAM
jgi:cation:H+ antiporter